MRLSHIHEGDKSQADPLKVRIVVENDIPEELPESDNPLDDIRDEFKKSRMLASISVEIWHNTKGVLETYAGEFDVNCEAAYDWYGPARWDFARYNYNLEVAPDMATSSAIQLPFLHTAHDAWYTMHYTDKVWGHKTRELAAQWLRRPMRSEFTLTWDHFMDIAEQLSRSNKINNTIRRYMLDLVDNAGLFWDDLLQIDGSAL